LSNTDNVEKNKKARLRAYTVSKRRKIKKEEIWEHV